MSDTDGKKPLGLGGAPRSGQVKQSFSHGRTKSVVVETKRKRVVVPVAKAGHSGGSRCRQGICLASGRPFETPGRHL